MSETRLNQSADGSVKIDPDHCFGRPRVKGVTTWIIRERFLGGESVMELSADYRLSWGDIEDALRYELTKRWKHPKGMARDGA